MQKKNISVVLIICLAMCSCLTYAEEPSLSFHSLLKDDFANYVYDAVSFSSDTENCEIAVLGASGIFLWNPVTTEHEELLATSSFSFSQSSDIFAMDGSIYVADIEKGNIYQVANSCATVVTEMNKDAYQYETSTGPSAKQFAGSSVIGNMYYLLLNSFTFEYGETYELYSYSKEQGINLDSVQKISRIYGQHNNSLIVSSRYDDGAERLCLYNPVNGELTKLAENMDLEGKNGFSLNSAGDTLYYTETNGNIMQVLKGKEPVICGYLPVKFVFNTDQGWLMDDKTYAYISGNSLYVHNIAEGNTDRTVITIIGSVDESIISKYSADNPDVSVSLKNGIYSESAIEQDILTNSGNTDIYVVTTDGLFPYMVEKQYAAPLNESDFLMSTISGYYAWAKNTLISNDSLFAVPIKVNVDNWTMNETKWKEFGFGETPALWKDVFELSSLWNDKYSDDYSDTAIFDAHEGVKGVIQDLVRQYLLIHEDWLKPVSFDNDGFKEIVQKALEYADVFESNMDYPLLMNYPQYFGTGYNDSDKVISIVPPAISEDEPSYVRCTMDLLVVNPACKQKDKVLDFLEYYVNNLPMDTQYRLSAENAEPVRSSNFDYRYNTVLGQISNLESKGKENLELEEKEQLETLHARAERMLNEDWLVSAEDIDIYRNIAKQIKVPQKTIYPKEISEQTASIDNIIAQFADGNIDINTFVRQLDEKSRMIFSEMQ